MGNNLNIKLFAFPGAPEEVFETGKKYLLSKIKDAERIKFSENDSDVFFIVSGGAENDAKEFLKGKQQILILSTDADNSNAAASEIKAYCDLNTITSILVNIDHTDVNRMLNDFIVVKKSIEKLKSCELGLIGNVSKWLIASNTPGEIIKSKTGISLKQVSWDKYPEYTDFEPNDDFIKYFKNSNQFKLDDSSRVFNLLNSIIEKEKLSAITVECFPMVRKHAVTACLALSKFNDSGIPAGCEGDLVSIAGKIIVKELTGQIPWMANLISVTDKSVLFAHCTIATNLVSDYSIKTHFETNSGTAIKGKYAFSDVTVVRFSQDFSKVFISKGDVIRIPELDNACRTQIEVRLPEKHLGILKSKPLGNHHLVLAGNQAALMKLYCRMMNIEMVSDCDN